MLFRSRRGNPHRRLDLDKAARIEERTNRPDDPRPLNQDIDVSYAFCTQQMLFARCIATHTSRAAEPLSQRVLDGPNSSFETPHGPLSYS